MGCCRRLAHDRKPAADRDERQQIVAPDKLRLNLRVMAEIGDPLDQIVMDLLARRYIADDEGLVRQGERLGVIVLGIGEEVMDVLNSPGFAPKAF